MGTALLSMYVKCEDFANARQVFENICQRNVVSYNAMIGGYSHYGHHEEALQLFCQMQLEGIKPDKITFMNTLNACASPTALKKGKWMHAQVIRARLESDVCVGTALVCMYTKCGSVVRACHVFDAMSERDVFAWNVMISGCAQEGHGEEACELFWQMQREGLRPDKITFIAILNACSATVALEKGKQVHADIMKAGCDSDLPVCTALISMYAKCGSVVSARQVFNGMAQQDVVSCNALIAGYAQQGHGEEALNLFWQMQGAGVKPNKVTLISIHNACASLAALEEGEQISAHIIQAGLVTDLCVGNALISMFSKCGSIGSARQVFEKMPKRDVFSWTAMVAGYSQHGCANEAFRLFEQMQLEGVKPDMVIFIGVLSACSHVGLVDEGCHLLQSMSNHYNIIPTQKHYGCMVDLLGRSGNLDEAEDLNNKMPFEADASVWTALLGGCRIHGNVDLAERAAASIVKLEPFSSAVYVLLSKIYSAAGRWYDVAKVRTVMEERGVIRRLD